MTYTMFKGVGVWGSGPQTDKHLPQSHCTGQRFRLRHFAFPTTVLSFYYMSQAQLYFPPEKASRTPYIYAICDVKTKSGLETSPQPPQFFSI